MNSGECLKLSALPKNIQETNDNSPDKTAIADDLLYQLIPSINAVHLIAELIETQALGKIKLGPYEQYILDLKECAQSQHQFSQKLAQYLKK